ncbi:glycerol-3-phosphate dehydrogenase/oxidase [Rhodococcus triatomae]|nr:glycerol-3-phosphate dehydrogenase/oxidase [Rhodococcus triatomae]QNG25695.1 glycerol-3-phosphate dehydrogenase/oxidase [Rhodococcus triatomae]
MYPTPLSPSARRESLERMSSGELDVLVIGAGVVGAGAALDAVTRGLTVGLVEARDYASGTSSRSSKLVHGGLRYLEQLDFALVFEALRERSLILDELAPHLARPVEFVYPLQRRGIDRAWVGLGVGVYDVLGAGRGVPAHHRHLSKRKTLQRFPGAKRGAVHGGVSFYEGSMDDARFAMTLARTAASHGALCAGGARVVDFLREGERVVGARVLDVETGTEFDVRARRTINATGPWNEKLQSLIGGEPPFRVQASKGVHIVVPREKIASTTGLITQTEKSLLFVIPCPWSERYWVIGTTDTAWHHDLDDPAASGADVDYILDHVNELLAHPLTRADVVGVYSGLRPLVVPNTAAGDAGETTTLSREHVVVSPVEGLVSVAGGKYTTYRVMAEDAVNMAVEGLDGVEASHTDRVPLVGARGYGELWSARTRLAAELEVDVETVEHLLGRYGSAVIEIAELLRARPELAEKVPGYGYLWVEMLYAVTHEGALHLEDVLARRTHADLESSSGAVDIAEQVAELIAPELGWSDETVAREVGAYRARVAADVAATTQPDDASAVAAQRVERDAGSPGGRVAVVRSLGERISTRT